MPTKLASCLILAIAGTLGCGAGNGGGSTSDGGTDVTQRGSIVTTESCTPTLDAKFFDTAKPAIQALANACPAGYRRRSERYTTASPPKKIASRAELWTVIAIATRRPRQTRARATAAKRASTSRAPTSSP